MTTAAEFYDARAAWRSGAEERGRFRAAAAIAGLAAKARVIDLGCRDGGLALYLPRPVAYQGYDVSFASSLVKRHDVTQGIPEEAASADAVFALDVLEHLPNPHAVLAEMRRVVKAEGVVIVSVPNPYHAKEIIWNVLGIADRQGHVSSWTPQTMAAMGKSVGLYLERSTGTYLVPGIPAPRLFARSIVYRFRTWAVPGWLQSASDGLRAGSF